MNHDYGYFWIRDGLLVRHWLLGSQWTVTWEQLLELEIPYGSDLDECSSGWLITRWEAIYKLLMLGALQV